MIYVFDLNDFYQPEINKKALTKWLGLLLITS
jgi:hypothetical protein